MKSKYQFVKDMEQNDTVVLSGVWPSKVRKMQLAVRVYAWRHGIKITTKRVKGGLLVRRVD